VPTLFPVTAVIELTFAPIVSIGGFEVRLETIALAGVILVALVVATLIAWGTPLDPARPTDSLDEDDEPNHLRADDLLYVAVGALPGAVAGGRIGYVLLHLDYYTANQGAVLDIAQGGFQLSLAVVGGTITAVIVATMLGGSIGRWLHALIVPLLLALAGGKLAMLLGGDGQGTPWDGSWATAYPGPGPWGSLAPQIPSHPAQAYEAVATILVLLLLMMVLAAGGFQRRGGGAFLLGIAMWAGARAAVASTWRDPVVVGELRMDQLLSLGIVAGAMVLLAITVLAAWLGSRRPAPTPAEEPVRRRGPTGGPEWPDPTSRPRI
jgi:phosphatidylglycerol---prolipoprotein diacylglyceryl transferase